MPRPPRIAAVFPDWFAKQPFRYFWIRVSACFETLILCGALAAAQDIKEIHPVGYVTDLAGVLPSEAKNRLELLCTDLQQKTGAQMAVVTVPSLGGVTVEEYAVDLYKQLGVGGKKDNRGVLLLVAPNDRKYRIEVGYGLEPVINDARAGDAGRLMVPLLRQRNYGDAISVAVWQLAKYVADDQGVTLSLPPPFRPTQAPARDRASRSPNIPLWLIFGGIYFIFHLFAAAWRKLTGQGPRRRGGWWGWTGGGGFGGDSGGWGGGDSGGGFGGFGGGSSGGGGASGDW